MSAFEQSVDLIQFICPSADELGAIINEIRCEECDTVFCSESRFRMHDLKVHKKKNMEKSHVGNVRYHCPVKDCIYAPGCQKHFMRYKYLKQHYLKVHAEKRFICIHCTKSFSTNAAKDAHMKVCGTNFLCECQNIFNSYEALLTHAKRNNHKVDEKYRSKRRRKLESTREFIPSKLGNRLIAARILPKVTCDKAIQTDITKDKRKSKSPKNKNIKSQVCRQTQTNDILKDKQMKKSAETQTAKAVPRLIRVHQVGKRKKISIDKDSVIRENINLIETLSSSEYISPDSPLSLRHDIILQDFWEEKSSSGTQTSPEKNIFGNSEDYSVQNAVYHGLSRSDPMLTEKAYADKFNSIETQTEKAYCRSIFESDPISSNNETQTTEHFTEPIEQLHIYNNTYTQTCDEILPPDLGLSDIQTQTAWNNLDETTVSTETQTKALKCLSGCTDSNLWFTTQTNHMETQTDLLHIFDDLG